MSPSPRPAFAPRPVWRAVLAALLAHAGVIAPLSAQSGSGDSFPSFPRNDSASLAPILIYFPPNPPPLGRAIARPTSAPPRGAAPAELAAYVNEPFYPALGTRLATKSLSARLRAQVEAYRATKTALQDELRAELDRWRDADPAARLAGLMAFAPRQAAKIAELETAAEQLRRDLIASDQTWGALRTWRLGDNDRRGFSPLEIAQVMRAAAFYQTGLLPAQRRLLREISIELMMAGDNTETATVQQPYLFFPPEPARVLFPDDVPAPVAASLATYQTKKTLLKKELYDAVYAYDGQKFTFLRGNPLKALAEKQAAALVELETLAEEIRRGLAAVAEPAAIVERTPLPPVLHHRVATLVTDFSALQKDATGRLDAIIAANRELPMQAVYRFEADGLKFMVIQSRAGRGSRGPPPPVAPEILARINEVRAQFTAVAEDYGQRVAALINEKDAIRIEIGRTLGNAKATAIDNAFYAAMRVVTANETAGQYRDFRVAVFQPGLSPGQRRLLFDHVLERLELPLPRGEPQPVYRANSW